MFPKPGQSVTSDQVITSTPPSGGPENLNSLPSAMQPACEDDAAAASGLEGLPDEVLGSVVSLLQGTDYPAVRMLRAVSRRLRDSSALTSRVARELLVSPGDQRNSDVQDIASWPRGVPVDTLAFHATLDDEDQVPSPGMPAHEACTHVEATKVCGRRLNAPLLPMRPSQSYLINLLLQQLPDNERACEVLSCVPSLDLRVRVVPAVPLLDYIVCNTHC